jgi:hypothetical protein
LTENHSFPILKGDGRVRHSTFESARDLAAFFEKTFYIINPLLEKKAFILFL